MIHLVGRQREPKSGGVESGRGRREQSLCDLWVAAAAGAGGTVVSPRCGGREDEGEVHSNTEACRRLFINYSRIQGTGLGS